MDLVAGSSPEPRRTQGRLGLELTAAGGEARGLAPLRGLLGIPPSVPRSRSSIRPAAARKLEQYNPNLRLPVRCLVSG